MNPTRIDIAERYGLPVSTLRTRESSGALPVFGTVPLDVYRARLELILAARVGGLSTQRIRAAMPRRS